MSRMNTRDLPEWMNNFISTFNKEDKKVVASTKKIAEVNVKDLPKVVWNDETFYTMFDNGDATVLNEFGNTVTTIKGASTIESVDQHLNGKQVVISNKEDSNRLNDSILEEELNKVSAYLSVEADDQQQNGQQAPQGEFGTPAPAPQDEFGAPVPTSTDGTQPNNNADQSGQQVDNLENDVNNTTASIEVAARFASMEDQVQTLTKQVTALTEQLRGYQDPGAIYDLNVAPAEEQHYQETAQQSAQAIEKEHNTDLTTMQGRVSLVDKIMEDIDTIMDTNETDLTVDEQDLNDLNNIVIEEPAADEEQSDDSDLVELDIPDIEIEEDPKDDDKDIDVDNKDVDVVEEPKDDDSDKKDEDAEPADDKKEDDKKENDDEEIVKLNSRDSKIFKERICPDCGEKMLTLSNKVAHVQGVYCKGCKTEYGVDTTNETIYKKA